MKTRSIRQIVIVVLLALAACQSAERQEPANLVLTNGYVYTVDASRSVAEAVNRFLAHIHSSYRRERRAA